MRLSTKIAYNTLVQIIGKVISTTLALLAIAIITRELGQTGFGEYTTILTFISLFAITADLGLTIITVQMISKPDADEEYILGNLLGLRLVTALLFLGIAPIIVLFLPYSDQIKNGVAIISLSFLFIALNQVLVGLFQKKLSMDKVAISEAISRLFMVGGVIVALKMNTGLTGILIATVLANLVSFLFHFYFSRKYAIIKLRFNLGYWKKILILSWPLAMTITLNLIYLKTDTLLLSIIKRKSEIGIIAEVGLYGAAYKIIDVLITLPFMFAGVVLPILTALWAKKETENFKNVLQRSFNAMAIIGLPIVFGTQFIAEEIMVLVAGKDFALSGPILQLLIVSVGLIFLGNMLAHGVIAIERQKKVIGAYLFIAVTSFFGYLFLIPHFSYFAAAWVTIYSELVVALASGYVIYKYTKFIPSFNIVYRSIAASLVMTLVIKLMIQSQYNNLFVVIITAILVYSVFIYLFRGITKKEILEILNIKTN